MSRKWNLLQIGTRIRVKGKEDVEGTISDYVTDNGEIKGYRVAANNGLQLLIALDDKFEVLKK
jgi:hypothetical protein